MSEKRGKLIVIEGIDGSGKTTQVQLLENRIDYLELEECWATREASDGPIGTILREQFLSGKRKSDYRTINYLYAADRLDHITNEEDGMLKRINEGKHVITDRYYMSSMAYYAMEFYGTPEYEKALKFILDLNMVNRDLLPPTITIFIRVSPEVAMERINANRSKDDISVYESLEKLKRISAAYDDSIEILRSKGDKIVEINGEAESWLVFDRVCHALRDDLKDIWCHDYDPNVE